MPLQSGLKHKTMSKEITYTVSIYTENNIGLLNRVSAIFQRRHINIESINSSISEIDGFLIGGASQSSKKFIDIVKKYYK